MNSHAPDRGGLALLFEPRTRPTLHDIAAVLAQGAGTDGGIAISHRPDPRDGWVELLCRGLTFDLAGLAPGQGEPWPEVAYDYDLPGACDVMQGEVLTLTVGQHLAGGGHLLPVVRAQMEVALGLLALPGLRAVVWQPAAIAMSAGHFSRVLSPWLNGGPFPALGLTYLTRSADGTMVSHGLSFFTGQELSLAPMPGRADADLGKLAVRLIHKLVDSAPIETPCDIIGPDGEVLFIEPVENGHRLRVGGRVLSD
ncbi:MAG: hypothetical protein KGJ57_08030 [Sphingomonadales bacterium]|nr:hypothetical protein [Sphingomonadales bacterium]MDE2169362.1 hypothetical protein [Sphingomonadales bacterium]